MTSKRVEKAVAAYAARHERTVERTEAFIGLITSIIDDAGIDYLTVTGRAKTVASFRGKARRVASRGGDPHTEITDQVGVRVITYVQSDILAVADLLMDRFTVLEDRDMGQETASEGRFGYASRHLLLSCEDDATGYDPEQCVSVQLRTVLQHAWAEFEHDVRYKGTVPPEHVPDLDRRFTLAAGLLELADREFSIIRTKLQSGMGEETLVVEEGAQRIRPRELATFLAGRYSATGFSRAEHYEKSADLLAELEIRTVEDLSAELKDVDAEDVSRSMGYRYPPGAARRLDDDLLFRFREQYVELPSNGDRRDQLRGRMQRLGRGQ